MKPRPAPVHLCVRPFWLCRECEEVWPCPTAQAELLTEYETERIALSVLLASCLHDAIADLARQHPDKPIDPLAMFARFVGWVPRPPARVY